VVELDEVGALGGFSVSACPRNKSVPLRSMKDPEREEARESSRQDCVGTKAKRYSAPVEGDSGSGRVCLKYQSQKCTRVAGLCDDRNNVHVALTALLSVGRGGSARARGASPAASTLCRRLEKAVERRAVACGPTSSVSGMREPARLEEKILPGLRESVSLCELRTKPE
jgi:hypothetical protein